MPAEPPVKQDDKTLQLQLVFGKNLRAARLARGLTQAEIAKVTGVPQQHLSLIEVGKQNVTLRTMVLLSEVVGCSVSDLLRS